MRVLVTGATGYIGGAVCAALKRHGHDVIGLARSEESAERLRSLGYEVALGDITQPETIAAAARKAEGAIHTATVLTQDRADVERQIVDVFLQAFAGTDRPFIYTSGVYDYGAIPGVITEESSTANPPAFIAWRPPLVDSLLQAGKERGVRSIVIRPGVVYGEGDSRGGFAQFVLQAKASGGVASYVGTGENHWTSVHIADLAELYVLALEKAPAGSLYIAVSGPALTVREIAEAASRAAGGTGRTQAIPLEEARARMGLYVDARVLDQQASNEKARRELGWSPDAPSLLEELSPEGWYATSLMG